MNDNVEDLKTSLRAWLDDVDDAMSDDPSGHDADVRLGARWWDHDKKIREELRIALNEVEEPTNLIQPDEIDKVYWYRMQSFGVWYAVKACCRSCATTRLHYWTEQFPYSAAILNKIDRSQVPNWIIPLKDR